MTPITNAAGEPAWEDLPQRSRLYAMCPERGRKDVVARVERWSSLTNEWEITTWAGPFMQDSKHRMFFKGTLDEAKAVAIADMRLR